MSFGARSRRSWRCGRDEARAQGWPWSPPWPGWLPWLRPTLPEHPRPLPGRGRRPWRGRSCAGCHVFPAPRQPAPEGVGHGRLRNGGSDDGPSGRAEGRAANLRGLRRRSRHPLLRDERPDSSARPASWPEPGSDPERFARRPIAPPTGVTVAPGSPTCASSGGGRWPRPDHRRGHVRGPPARKSMPEGFGESCECWVAFRILATPRRSTSTATADGPAGGQPGQRAARGLHTRGKRRLAPGGGRRWLSGGDPGQPGCRASRTSRPPTSTGTVTWTSSSRPSAGAPRAAGTPPREPHHGLSLAACS